MKLKKISVVLIASSFLFVGFFSSCNKKLKKELDEQKQEIADLKAQQDATNATLGFNSPPSMSMTTTTTTATNPDSAISVNRSYKFTTGPNTTNMQNNHDGTWDVYMYVTEVSYWDNDSYIGLTYNPTTKVVTDAYIYMNYYDYQYDYKNVRLDQNDPNTTATFTVNNFNTTSGAFEITASGSTNASSSYNIYSGKPYTANFHYSGTLTVFQ
jgi:hypothetical protein